MEGGVVVDGGVRGLILEAVVVVEEDFAILDDGEGAAEDAVLLQAGFVVRSDGGEVGGLGGCGQCKSENGGGEEEEGAHGGFSERL